MDYLFTISGFIFSGWRWLPEPGTAACRYNKEPNLYGERIKRMVVDNLVIDQEVVTRNFPQGRGKMDVIAIYEIEQGKIAKAWFKIGPCELDEGAL